MGIYSPDELEEKINQAIKEVLDEVMERTHNLLLQHINIDTYHVRKREKGHPKANKNYLNKTGIPTYEFRDKAWSIAKFKDELKSYAISLFFDGNLLSPPSPGFKTRHRYDRLRFAELLNVEGEVGHKDRSPFWDNFMVELRDNLGMWLYSAFKKRGLIISELRNYKF